MTCPDNEPADPFEAALEWLWPIEGGWHEADATDPNPTMYGVTQDTWAAAGYKGSVAKITQRQAAGIYRTEYWLKVGCPGLKWPEALVHFDAAVNHGTKNAWKLLVLAKCNWVLYIAARRDFYADIIKRHPSQEVYRKGWENRMKRLEAVCRQQAASG